MITLSGRLKDVYEISEVDIKVPQIQELELFGKMQKMYVSPSNSVLAHITKEEVEFVVGREASKTTLKNAVSFGAKCKLPLKVLKCEVLSNLREIDRMVVLVNSLLGDKDELTLEFIARSLDNEEIE